jgi:hypothetical protein
LGGKDAGRWTASDPFRPDKFGNRIDIFVRHQIIHVSHLRSRERQPKPLATSRVSPKILVRTEILNGLRAGFRRALLSFCGQSLINELVSKFLANFVL